MKFIDTLKSLLLAVALAAANILVEHLVKRSIPKELPPPK